MKIKRVAYLTTAIVLSVTISTCLADDVFWDDGGTHLVDNETYRTDYLHLDYHTANIPGTHLDLVDGGSIGQIGAYNNATITMSGGWTDFIIHCYDDSNISVTGGIAPIAGHDNAYININGGNMGAIAITDYAKIDFYDSDSCIVTGASGNGIVNIYGGNIDQVVSAECGRIYLFECTIGNEISALDSSSIFIYGTDLEKYSTGGKYGNGYVTGDWISGNYLLIDFGYPDTYSHIHLVPEPSLISLFAIGSMFLRKSRRYHL